MLILLWKNPLNDQNSTSVSQEDDSSGKTECLEHLTLEYVKTEKGEPSKKRKEKLKKLAHQTTRGI